MPLTEINHVNFRTDRETMHLLRDFYCNVLGLTVGKRVASTTYGYWLYIGENDVIHLAEYKTSEPPQLHVHGTYDHVSFTCTDMPAMEVQLQAHGMTYTTRILANGVRQINLKDPAGNGVELNFEEYRDPAYVMRPSGDPSKLV
ncbi:VOC family protein [Methylophilus aquaticus]|uniref:VOC family protein n=1 Tax=Methylophilus aquaticus TaxID=1971610 RepID=A0ABT9JPN3_9PROT|nr:VOC family protein [Methylophilus aquaticus]MDP8566527.1 VOC family protein [Methylophilus aquaticus]